MPGLAAKAPTGISQEGSQLSRDFTFACVLYIKVVVFFLFFLRNKKSLGSIVYLLREVLFCAASGCQLDREPCAVLLSKLHLCTHRAETLEVVLQKELG